MKILGEFREFISRGNVVDLAVGVIIGAAFSSIITTLVDKVIMPPIGLATSGVDFANLQWVLKPDNPATKASELVAVQYGVLINTLIQFLADPPAAKSRRGCRRAPTWSSCPRVRSPRASSRWV